MRLAAFIAAGALAGCVSAGGGADDPGRRMFRAKCTSCHVAPDPAQHSDAEWTGLVHEYGREANCSPEELAQILGYLRRTNERD